MKTLITETLLILRSPFDLTKSDWAVVALAVFTIYVSLFV
jgi:hypothetical protein